MKTLIQRSTSHLNVLDWFGVTVIGDINSMKILDLFSGIGGFSLGLEAAGMETSAFCEYDENARNVLSKHWPDVPIFNDVKTLNKELLNERGISDIGLICGGYPCQPFSLAGQRRGAEDDRHLWPEMFRLIQELRPNWVIGENVFGHISMGLDQVLSDLENSGYATRSFVIPACAVDAPHRRDRIWTIANNVDDPKSLRCKRTFNDKDSTASPKSTITRAGFLANANARHSEQNENLRTRGYAIEFSGQTLGHSKSIPRHGVQDEFSKEEPEAPEGQVTIKFRGSNVRTDGGSRGFRKWELEPRVGRVVDGVPNRTHRLKQLGNAIVPQVAQVLGEIIMEIEGGRDELYI